MTSILVVDDEPSYTEALTVSLRREGFDVRAVADGAAAMHSGSWRNAWTRTVLSSGR